MMTTTRPGLGLTHAAGTIEPVGTAGCARETQRAHPGSLGAASPEEPSSSSPAPGTVGLSSVASSLPAPKTAPLSPKAASTPTAADALGGQMARGGSSGGRAAQSRGQPGAALREASGRMDFPASLEKGSQTSFYGLGTRFSPSCEGREH